MSIDRVTLVLPGQSSSLPPVSRSSSAGRRPVRLASRGAAAMLVSAVVHATAVVTVGGVFRAATGGTPQEGDGDGERAATMIDVRPLETIIEQAPALAGPAPKETPTRTRPIAHR